MIKTSLAALLAIASASACLADTLHIGDQAPSLTVKTWIQGTPMTRLAKGRVYVVEFWATWCPPCQISIPHLSEIARKYAKDVTVIGVDAREAEAANGKVSTVRAFVKAMGPNMSYSVAMDDPKQMRTFGAWMTASGMHLIPTAFIVDKQGRITWIGHPTEGFDMFEQRVAETIAGTIDLAASKAHHLKEIPEMPHRH